MKSVKLIILFSSLLSSFCFAKKIIIENQTDKIISIKILESRKSFCSLSRKVIKFFSMQANAQKVLRNLPNTFRLKAGKFVKTSSILVPFVSKKPFYSAIDNIDLNNRNAMSVVIVQGKKVDTVNFILSPLVYKV